MCLRWKEIDAEGGQKDALGALPVSWAAASSFCSRLDHCNLNQGLKGLSVMYLVVA